MSVGVKFPDPLVEARLVRRYKRFLADVEWPDGTVTTAHIANPGSMLGLATEGARVWLSPANNPKRKLRHSVELIEADGVPVLVNTARPNAVAGAALTAGAIPAFARYSVVRPEVKAGEEGSRIDFLLTDPKTDERLFLEVKSVTLGASDTGWFPDAVTKRGQKHLRELARLRDKTTEAGLLFLVGRGDVEAVRPADRIDPAYGALLREVVDQGVQVHAWQLDVSPTGLAVSRELPVRLTGGDGGPQR